MIVGLLADIDALGLPPDQVDRAFVGQPVVEHDIGLLHQAESAESQEIGIARPRADQIDLAAGRRRGVLRGCAFDCAGKFGVRGAIVAGKRPFSDRSLEDGLPEPPAHDRRGNGLGDRIAESARQPRQAAVRGRDQAFETRLEHAPQNRRCAPGRYRDDERASIDDRGHDEVAQQRPVGDVDQRARALCRRPRLGREPLVVGRDEAERRALEVLRLGIARLVPEVRRVQKSAEIVGKRGRERGHASAGLGQRFRPPRRHDPAADDHGRPAGQFEKDRQMPHRYRPRDFTARNRREPAKDGLNP